MPLWHTTDQALAAPATAAQPHHLGIGGGLVDEHKVRRIKHALFSHPASARPRHIRALLLRRAQAFFEGDLVTLEQAPDCRAAANNLCLRITKTTWSSVRSDCFSIRPSRKSACFSKGEMLPPRGLATQRPVSRKHLTQIIAVLALTSNPSAASRREAPPSTSAITRPRMSAE